MRFFAGIVGGSTLSEGIRTGETDLDRSLDLLLISLVVFGELVAASGFQSLLPRVR
jgi:hypothetical protein